MAGGSSNMPNEPATLDHQDVAAISGSTSADNSSLTSRRVPFSDLRSGATSHDRHSIRAHHDTTPNF
jgi:hypothetical protein